MTIVMCDTVSQFVIVCQVVILKFNCCSPVIFIPTFLPRYRYVQHIPWSILYSGFAVVVVVVALLLLVSIIVQLVCYRYPSLH